MRKIIIVLSLLMPLLVFAQDAGKKKAYYFYGEQCPHCQNVDEYFKTNGIYEKYNITKLEFSNPFNTRLLVKFGEVFNSESKGSVPAIAFGDKFITGDQPIIEGFMREIDAADNANELPDPEKVGNANATGNQRPASAEATAGKGNKKNYFPAIITALIVIVGGALIWVNRSKKS